MNIPINEAITPNFDSIETFLKAFKETPLISNASAEGCDQIYPLVRQFLVAAKRTFPEGVPMEDDSRRKLEELYDDCHPMIKQLALRSFVPNLAFYTDASMGRKAVTMAFCEIMSAIIEFLPADVARKHAPSRAFVTKAHEIAQKLGNILGFKYDELGKEDDDEDCDCPACTLRRKLVSQLHASKPKVEVSDLSPDDPSLPADVKEIVEGIKEQGGTPVLQQITAKINFTNPEEWDDAIQKFPAEARPQILRELRKQYRKATGKYAPGDPTIQNQ